MKVHWYADASEAAREPHDGALVCVASWDDDTDEFAFLRLSPDNARKLRDTLLDALPVS